MGKRITQIFFAVGLLVSSTHVFSQVDPYFASGEDIDFIIESDNSYALQELEYKLRRFVLFRKVEDYLLKITDIYFEKEEY